MIPGRNEMKVCSFFIMMVITVVTSCNSSPTVEQKVEVVETEKDSAVGPAPVTSEYDSYCNARFNYCVDYPGEWLTPQPESDNGDGLVFKDVNGDNVLTVYGRLNLSPEGEPLTLTQQYQSDLDAFAKDGISISYKTASKDGYVISGVNDGKIFYQRTILKGDALAYAILRYSEADKGKYEAVIKKLMASFK